MLCAAASLLPMSASTRAGAAFGRLWSAFRFPRVARVEAQLAKSFPEWSVAEQRETATAVFVHLGESLAELILLGTRHREELIGRVEITGLEHLEAARRASEAGGVILLTGHCGHWELGGIRLAREGFPLAATQRGLTSSGLSAALQRLRLGRGPSQDDYSFLSLGTAGLPFVRALSKGRSVLVLLDQNARREEAVFAPFFGRPAAVRPGPVRIALRRGIPMVPIFIRRLESGGRHRIEIFPALDLDRDAPVDDVQQENRNIALVTGTIELAIRRAPSQWIWTHRRWRTQPEHADSPEGGHAHQN